MNLVQYFAYSTGIDDSFQASLKSAGKLVAELGVVTATAASSPSVLQDWPFQLLPSARAEGKETPSLPQELGHQLVCPYGEERHETHIDLSVSLLLSVWEEMPHLPSSVLLLCKGETLFPATQPMHTWSREKKEEK